MPHPILPPDHEANPLELLRRAYPALVQVSEALAKLGQPDCPVVGPLQAPAGTVLFSEHAPCQGFPLVLQGEVCVTRSSGDGRQLELYRVLPGELCLVSSASLFRARALSANGVATRETRLLMVPPTVFMAWLGIPSFRDEVLGLFADRMADLTVLVDAVAFKRLDQRLASALLGHGTELAVTHQALADRLGTVREIVTRLLRRFEREGWVSLSRECIRIVDSAALRLQAGADAG